MDGDTLKKKRKDLRMTQAELAAKLGVSRNTINRWEAGTIKIPSEMVELSLKQIETDKTPKKKTR